MIQLLQQPLKLLIFLAFFASFVASAFLLVRMPVFSHIDELAHFDYVLKVQRHQPLSNNQLIEPDLMQLWTQRCPTINKRSMAPETPLDCVAPQKSYEIMQPSPFYRVAAFILNLASPANLSLPRQLLLLRFLCALLLLAANILVYRGISRVNRTAGLLSLAYLVPFVPVDMLRFSNDSAATFAGAGAFYCLVGMLRTSQWRFAFGVGLFLFLVTISKLTGLVFVSIALLASTAVFTKRENFHLHCKFMILIATPAAVASAVIAQANISHSGSITGLSPQAASTLPEGSALLLRVFSATVWQWWHESWLTMETLIKGKRGVDLYPVPWMVTWMILGQVLALGYCIFVPSKDAPHRFIAAGLISTLAIQTSAVLILAYVGKIWIAARMLIPIEGWPLLAACMGYTMAASRLQGRRLQKTAVAVPAITFAIFALIALRAYLRMRAN